MKTSDIYQLEDIEKDLRNIHQDLHEESEKVGASGVIAKSYKKLSEVVGKLSEFIGKQKD